MKICSSVCTDKVLREIHECLKNCEYADVAVHAVVTRATLLKDICNGDADNNMEIAALGYCIERASADTRVPVVDHKDYLSYKAHCSVKSAEIVMGIMKECGASQEAMEDVCSLITNTFSGGCKRSQHLRDAEAISYFDVIAQMYIEKFPTEVKKRCIVEHGRLSENGCNHIKKIFFFRDDVKAVLQDLLDDKLAYGVNNTNEHYTLENA